MEMLNNVSMILANDLWTNIINWFSSWVPNYGWAIIVFTIALKLLMSPLDIYQRISSQKQQRFMNVMQPELAAVQAKYANDKEKLNQETAKIYKKNNFSMGGMCVSMLVTMGLSMVIFFSLFGSLNALGKSKLYDSYKQLDIACEQVVGDKKIETLTDDERADAVEVVLQKQKELNNKNSWLWVKNVWKSDTDVSQFVSLQDYLKTVDEADKELAEDRYKFITSTIVGNSVDDNGYYVLIILAIVVSFLTQYLSTKLMSQKGQKLNTMNKVMMGIIPATMAIMAFTSNVVFTLYIITNSIMTAIISTILTMIMKSKNKGKTDEEIILSKRNIEVVEYSRNYKK